MASTARSPALPSPPSATPTYDDLVTLQKIAAGTARHGGEALFTALVARLAELLGVGYALLTEQVSASTLRALAYQTPDGLQPPAEWDVEGLPCVEVAQGGRSHHPTGLQERFPRVRSAIGSDVDSYLGAALTTPDGEHLGHLCVMDKRPLPEDPRRLALFHIFAARAAAELAQRSLIRTIGENEERLRDLFDEAPIAYVHEGLDSRFIRANRTGLRVLGVRPEEVSGTYGKTFAPDTPDAQRRMR